MAQTATNQQNSSDPERPPGEYSGAQEKAIEKQGGEIMREAVKREARRDRVDVSIEKLDEKAQAEVVEQGIDFNQPLQEQPEIAKIPLLFAIEYEIIPVLLDAGVDESALRSIHTVDPAIFEKKIVQLEKKYPKKFSKWGVLTRTSFAKLMYAINHKATPLSSSIFTTDVWKNTVDKALTHYTPAKAMLDTPSALWDKTKQIPGEVYHWIKTHKKESIKIATAAAVVGGVAYLIHRLLKRKSEKSEPKDETIDWKKKLLIGGSVTAVAVGVLYVLSKIFPGGDKAREWINDLLGIKKVAEKAKEKVEEGIAWLEEKIHFQEMKKKVLEFCKQYNIPLEEWMKHASLGQIMKDMQITEGNSASWQQYAVEGGAALLIYKWMGFKGLAVNSALYLLFVREGKNSFGSRLLSEAVKDFDVHKARILAGMKGATQGALEFVKHALESGASIDSVDDLLELMKENKVMSMVALNGLLLCSGLIISALKKILKTGFEIGFDAIRDPKKSLMTAGLSAIVLGTLYEGRRKFVMDIVSALYEDTTTQEAKSTLAFMDRIFSIDRSKPETIAEKHIPAFAEKIIENPLEALTKPGIVDAWKAGKWAGMWDLAGRAWLVLKGLNAPLLLGKLTLEAFDQVSGAYSKGEHVLAATVVGGVEGYVLGSMAWEGAKATWTIVNKTRGPVQTSINVIKALTGPWTAEGKFIWRSAIFNGIPPSKAIMELVQWNRIRETQKTLQTIKALAQKTAPDFKEIARLAQHLADKEPLFKNWENIKDTLKVTNFTFKNQEKLSPVKDAIKGIIGSKDAAQIIKVAQQSHDELGVIEHEARGFWRKAVEKGMAGFQGWRGFTLAASDLKDLVTLTDTAKIQALLKTRGIEALPGECAQLAAATDETSVATALDALAQSKGIKINIVPEIGALGKGLVYTGKAIGVAGIVMYGYQSAAAFYGAATTDVEGRAGVLAARGLTHAAEAGASAALLFGEAAIAKSAAATAATGTAVSGGQLALGAAGGLAGGVAVGVWGSIAHNAIDSAYEKTKTSLEWATETGNTQLIHEWLSSRSTGGYEGSEYLTAGDAYRFRGVESRTAEHQATRKKIVAALIMQEDGTKESDPDRMHFMEQICNFDAPAEYAKCIELLRDSKIYAGIQKARHHAKKSGEKEYLMGEVDLLAARYDAPGPFAIKRLVQIAKEDASKNTNPNLKHRFESFGDGYLLDLFEQAFFAGDSLGEEQRSAMSELQAYLIFVRGVNPDIELRKRLAEREGKDLEVDAKALDARIENFAIGDITGEFLAYTQRLTDTPACYSLYQLGRFFGYTGNQNEEELKQFFCKERGGYFGIYWDGEEWAVSEQGVESDNEVGAELNAGTIAAMVKELRADEGNILEHRADSIWYSEGETVFAPEVRKMADILEQGLQNYKKIRLKEELPETKGGLLAAA